MPKKRHYQMKAVLCLKKEHAIGTFCDTASSRYALADAKVDLAKKYIEATNSRMCIRVPLAGDTPENKTESMQFNGDKINKVIAFAKKHHQVNPNGALLGCHTKKGNLSVRAKNRYAGDDPLTVCESDTKGKWPRLGEYINGHAHDEPVLTVCLSAPLLKVLATYAVKANRDSDPGRVSEITFKFYDGTTGRAHAAEGVHFEIETESGTAKGVLMPLTPPRSNHGQ